VAAPAGDGDFSGAHPHPDRSMEHDRRPGTARLIGLIFLFVLLGIPLTAFLWETLNKLMAGYFDPVRIAASIPVLLLFAGLLVLVARFARRLDGPPAA
jgi:hypothetical protein